MFSGVRRMIADGIVRSDPEELADFLYSTRGLNKKKLGEWQGEPDELHTQTLGFFSRLFEFHGEQLLVALRRYLSRLHLPGEAQKIDRILEAFAIAYYETNEELFSHPDTVHTLSFSIVMLNVDLHNPNIASHRRMTVDDFIRNNREIDQGNNVEQSLLREIYSSIKEEELKTIEDRDDQGNLFTSTVCQGWLRKQGGRTRGWQRRYFILTKQPPALYYFMNEMDVDPRYEKKGKEEIWL